MPKNNPKMTERAKIDEFWNWFQSVEASLAADIENPSLLQQLDARMHELDSMLSWEIGPGACDPRQLVISPNLDRDLWPKAQEIISRAPVIRGWEFYPARRPKDWEYKFLMERSAGRNPVQLDASSWEFVLLKYPDGDQEVLLQGNNLPALDDDERWHAAAITLESILGEDVLLDKINKFELVDQLEPRFAENRRPIQRLRETVLAA
jgi:hypothetical protein